jgi:pyruvate dehydrogenase E2 component (dihydrolipoamide acetyltransferase)
MAIPITIPRLGWNMEEGIFAGWLKRDGERVRAGEPLFRLESDKATEDVECLDEGVLHIPMDGPKEGDAIAVGVVIGYLLAEGEEFEVRPSAEPNPPGPPSRSGKGGEKAREAAVHESDTLPSPLRGGDGGGVKVSPRARRVAKELGIDPTTLHGTGRTGRIREKDVLAASGDTDSILVSPIRKLIAARMISGLRDAAPVTLTTTADATQLVATRKTARDFAPSYTDILIKLVAQALSKHRLLNARWAGERIIISKGIHIGIAVDTEAGLLVPVVRNVPSLSLQQITEKTRDLIERARAGKLAADEMRGGTFTITNLGAFGIDAFTPILHDGQSGILGIGRIRREPAVVDDRVVPRDRITLSLTFDHRVVDGAPAARFLQAMGALIEKPHEL